MTLDAPIAHGFGWLDWAVVAGFLAVTTVVGARLAGSQATIRDFFLGGRRLAWWAVCGSIIATEISAVTFIAVPSISFKTPGGDLTYLQWGIGAIMARVLIGLFFVPKYYREEIYSPYDYMGARLGPRVRTATTLLFFVGGVLGQGARLYVAGLVLETIAGIDLVTAIWIVGLFGTAWTLLGGITTVIWTDVIQFCVLVLGALAALMWAIADVPGGVGEVVRLSADAGKFRVLNAGADLSISHGLWVGILAMPFMNLAALGLDQVMAQRMFCCRNPGQARLAIIASSIGQLMAVLMLLVGLALHAYFQHFPPDAVTAAEWGRDAESVLPEFIVRGVPVGIRGLIAAALFAAAISSLDSAMAALSQTTLGAFRGSVTKLLGRLHRARGGSIRVIVLSKVLVVFWGVVLCAMATACIPIRRYYDNVVHLVFGLVAYTYGPLLGIFLLAILPGRRSDRGVPLAVFAGALGVFSLSVHDVMVWSVDCTDWIVAIGAVGLLVLAFAEARGSLAGLSAAAAAAVVVALIHGYQVSVNSHNQPVWPSHLWGYPVGTGLTLLVGWGLGRKGAVPRFGLSE